MNLDKNILPNENEYVITHYGCSNFENETHQIFWIGAIYFENNTKKYFFENGTEIDIIKKYYSFLEQNINKTIIHWSMNSPKFGFLPINKKAQELNINNFNIDNFKQIDLSEYLKGKYGENYVSRENGRLNNLAILNNFSGHQMNLEVKTLNDATNRLELFYSIVCSDKRGILKIADEPVNLSEISIVRFVNNFDKVKEMNVFNYFKTNLVDKKYISETLLNDYLQLAFDKKAMPIQKFSFEKLNTQKAIINIFYNYYKTTAGKPYGKQKEYLNLLCNYFNGFENFNIKNFSK